MESILEDGKVIKLQGNYVLITKKQLKEYQKDRENLKYLEEINRRFEDVRQGKKTKHDLIEA